MSLVAIVGRPNVGKSTLFNRLVGQRQAIVDATAGTTRDRHYGKTDWNGKEFSVIDTGGYAVNSDDLFEEDIRRQVMLAIDEADLILFMVEVGTGITDLDMMMANVLRRSGKPVIVVCNKVDNYDLIYLSHEFHSLGLGAPYCISSMSGSGTGDLMDAILAALPEDRKTAEGIKATLPEMLARHDKDGDSHYELASALIKSIRGSDPDAALYYLACLLEGGEDPRFVCRRLILSASEDIGLADPRALQLAVACQQAVEFVGMPEGFIPLAETTTYLALARKSNSSYAAYLAAAKEVKTNGPQAVPLHLRNATTQMQKEWGYGKDYKYPFAYYTYNNGFAFCDSTGVTLIDNNSGKALIESPAPNARRTELGKAILQSSYDDLGAR